MATSKARTVEEYLAELPPDRRAALSTVRQTILDNLPDGYEETMEFGMIAYTVPLARYPDTYNKKPLMYAALASQKNYMSLYLSSVYADPERAESFHERYRATGKKLDMGKSCVRFKKLDDIPLDLIAETIAATQIEDFITLYESARRR